MAWYSWFSHMYDASLERLYAPHRAVAFADLEPAERALVVPCGTGQDLPFLVERADAILGVDLSPGMLQRAQARVDREGWTNVELAERDVLAVEGEVFDLVVWSLGLTVVPDHEAALAHTWSLLRPGGRMVIFDAWAERRSFQTWQVELLARAHLDRKVWEPLEARAEDFSLSFLDDASPGTFGGRLLVARGRKAD